MVPIARKLHNNKGVALATALLLTLISLTMVMALLYMVTRGVQTSGQYKRYQTALEASYGGAEMVMKDIVPIIMQNYSSSTLKSTVEGSFPDGLQVKVESDQACLQKKLTSRVEDWPSGCSNAATAKASPDLSFLLQASQGSPFVVYSKIVDTIVGNSDTSGLQLEGAGVAESSTVLKPRHIPYVYRVEIQGERRDNPTARAGLSVLYAY